MFRYVFDTGRKGRPRREWREDTEDECCRTNVYSATQIIQDRGAWKKLIIKFTVNKTFIFAGLNNNLL